MTTMADTATQVQAPQAAEDTSKRKTRQPNEGTVVEAIPESTRRGFWADEFDWFQDHPGLIKRYDDTSQTTASYLRKEYGLDAHNRNTRQGRATLYVTYDPSKVAEIKAGASKGKGNGKPAPTTQSAPKGSPKG
jgi:hypothetical protein